MHLVITTVLSKCLLTSSDNKIIKNFKYVFVEISGPIILDSYRVIADFEKTSKHELNLHTDDLVEIVEKNQNGEKIRSRIYIFM